jgi:para-nitrobenzyl esterase
MCPQLAIIVVQGQTQLQFQGDEDCLTLNIFRAYPPPAETQPVIVSIHGGANRGGSGQLAPSALVAKGVIVVTVQYRLGLLGFLAHPLLTAEGGGSSGNYGLMDQIAALQWVQRNIAAFGGDTSRIMISGGSAGAIDVQALLVSPAAQGLFSRAEMASEGLREDDVLSLDDSAAYYQRYAQLLGCDNDVDVLACLRAKTAEDVVNALQIPPQSGLSTDRITLRLTLEPNVLPVDPFLALQQYGSPVPLLIGSNREDNLVIENVAGPLPTTDDDYRARLHRQFDDVDPAAADQVYGLYPPFPDYGGDPYGALVAVHSDYYVTCKDRQVALAASGAQRPAVWRYLFTHALENPAGYWNFAKAFHGLQYIFLFTDLQFSPGGPYTPTAAELQLADQMRGYWARFAATGDPNGAGAVQWLPYDNNENTLQLDDTIETIPYPGYHKDQCDYFATLPPPPL